VVLIALDDFVQVVQIRAQFSYGRSSGGECSWSFVMPRAMADPQLVTLTAWESVLMPLFVADRPLQWRLDAVLAEDRWPHERGSLVDDVRLGPIPEPTENGGPPQASPVISWRTGNEGRQNRGRTYMGPYPISSYSDENILDPGLSAVYDFAEAMIGTFTGPDVDPTGPRFAIVSKKPSDPDWPAGHYTLPTTYYFLERWGVVRRRMGYDWRT
jgi:hypothetical protein